MVGPEELPELVIPEGATEQETARIVIEWAMSIIGASGITSSRYARLMEWVNGVP